ncbi:MAG: tRNA (N6-threonylcarbamoyladenosine(37)-N6)-methyltransferase TrmO [Gammaproteobacteria bacterium]|nr:MAG: tRNA (N6-threonylcarbamoyladenosine(37)-N6)-methyltransferase TrmO [Gammaproteobacteria bacterium]
MNELTLHPVGRIHSPFREKFGIPRQPGLIPDVRMRLELLPPWDVPEAVTGLEEFSHVWLIFGFHAVARGQARPTVRPPRLGGNRRIGVFASRSTHRPNPLGLSVVALEEVRLVSGRAELWLRGGDLLDGTPVFDIKPYLPWAESLPDARGGFAAAPPERSPVVLAEAAEEALARDAELAALRKLIVDVVAWDPRPAYRAGATDERVYGVRIGAHDIHFRAQGDTLCILDIVPGESAHE